MFLLFNSLRPRDTDTVAVSVNCFHCNDVIMGAIASQITSLTIVYSIVYSDADQGKHQSSASLAFVRGNSSVTGEFPAQMASNAENVSIWWRHHASLVQVMDWRLYSSTLSRNNADSLSVAPINNIREILLIFVLRKMHSKMQLVSWRPFCSVPNVLFDCGIS